MKKNNFIKKVLLAGAIILMTFVLSKECFQLMIIQGESMYPAYHNFQLVIVAKHKKEIERGDVVAFYCKSLDTTLVKRVIALPGDFVQINSGILYVNNTAVSEDIIAYEGIAKDGIRLLQEEYFVLGDNLGKSKDSRYKEIGCIDKRDILGKVYPYKTSR